MFRPFSRRGVNPSNGWLPAASYGSMKKDSANHALIRLLAENTDKVIDLLSRKGYLFDILPVIALEIENRPGSLAEMAQKIRGGRH